jgi:hypothetical protein
MPLLIQLDMSKGEWFVKTEEPEPFFTSIEIGFTADSLPVVFEEFSFGFSSKVNGKSVKNFSYPEKGITYISTDQEYMISENIKANPDDLITVDVWAENAGTRHESSFDVIVPRPESPYPSWTWSESELAWIAPFKYPKEPSPTGNGYEWEEESLSWIPRVLEEDE